MASKGIEIEAIAEGSAAAAAGVRPGDRLVSINGEKIRDIIDLLYCDEQLLKLKLIRAGNPLELTADTSAGTPELGIMLKPFNVRKCANRCIFCFVLQLPKGMRKTLYLKDEDYRMSFLYGNYVTLTDLTLEDRHRIVEQRLSPLYISVHSTDTHIRNRMLGKADAPDLMKDMKYFASHNIRMHTQIVLCPGYNDGRVLKKTIGDLYRLYPYVQSIAVVPVGLTAHRKKDLRPVEAEEARAALDIIKAYQTRFKRKHGEHIVFAADEFYIKAGMELPPLEQYDELSQIENGVGMIALFNAQARKLRIQLPEKLRKRRFVTLTGHSFYPYLNKFIERLQKKGFDIEAVPVSNNYFGLSVTVTGLLTGRDVLRELTGRLGKDDILLIPDIVMREGDEIFLDDVSRQDIEHILGVKSVIIDSSPAGLVEALLKYS